MGSRNSTTKFRAGPGYLLDKNGCIIDVCGSSNMSVCNPCIPQFNSCSPCGPYNQFTFGGAQPCCEPELLNVFSRDVDQQPQLNIYNYTYEKPQACDPFYFNSCNPCFPTFSQRYIQPCFQKQFAQISLNPYQSICEPSLCELPYIQPFIQSFANYMPQRCETPIYPPLAMPAVLPNAQQFLNPFATLCSQNFYVPQSGQVVQQYPIQSAPPQPPPQFQTLPPYSATPQFQPSPQFQQAPQFQPPPQFQQAPQFQNSAPFQSSPPFQSTPPFQSSGPFQSSVPFQASPAFQPVSAFPSFQTQTYQQSPTPFQRPCSLPIAMPYSLQNMSNIPNLSNLSSMPGLPGLPGLPGMPSLPGLQSLSPYQQLPFQNPLLEHFAQLSARPCSYWL